MHDMQQIIRVPKKEELMPPWRVKTIETGEHPLKIEHDEYHLVWIHAVTVSMELLTGKRMSDPYVMPHHANDHFDEHEQEMIRTQCRDLDKVQWALDNSFDGLYIKKIERYESYQMVYRFGVYLPDHLATFWRVKYG